MVRPNLFWTSRELELWERPRTRAEVRTRQRWAPHCRACIDERYAEATRYDHGEGEEPPPADAEP